MTHLDELLVILLLEASVSPHRGFFIGLLEYHHNKASGFLQIDRTRKATKVSSSLSQFSSDTESNPTQCGRGSTQRHNIKKHRSLGAILVSGYYT